MVDFDNGPEEAVSTQPSGKKQVDFFASVRERGILNAGLDSLAKKYEDMHPGMSARWEVYRPGETGGTDMVAYREGQGFRAVRHSDLQGEEVTGSIVASEGLVRRGDLVLMGGPIEVANQIRLQDAEVAHADLRAPQRAYEANVEANKVTTSDGTVQGAKPFGKISQTVEELPKVGESQHPTST